MPQFNIVSPFVPIETVPYEAHQQVRMIKAGKLPHPVRPSTSKGAKKFYLVDELLDYARRWPRVDVSEMGEETPDAA